MNAHRRSAAVFSACTGQCMLCVLTCAVAYSLTDHDERVTSFDITAMIREIHGKLIEQRVPRLVPILNQVQSLLSGRPLVEREGDEDEIDENATVPLPRGIRCVYVVIALELDIRRLETEHPSVAG